MWVIIRVIIPELTGNYTPDLYLSLDGHLYGLSKICRTNWKHIVKVAHVKEYAWLQESATTDHNSKYITYLFHKAREFT